MTQVYLALYKGRKSGRHPKALAARAADWLIRTITRSPYSHCEIAISRDGGQFDCYSSSLRDGGVRTKTMPLPSEKWDLVPLMDNAALRQLVQVHYHKTKGKAYDYLGVLGVILPFGQNKDKWFCSEWCAAAIGLPEPETYTPQMLAAAVQAA